MIRNNQTAVSGIRYIGGGATFSVGGQTRNGWSIANRVAFGRGTSYPVGYRENAMKLPVSETGQLGATNSGIGRATVSNPGGIFGEGYIEGSASGLATTSSDIIEGVVKSGSASGIGSTNTPTLAGSGFIGATLNIGFKPSAFDIAQEVWGAIASLNNVIGTMGELLNSGGGGGGGGGPTASAIATAVWDRLLSGHTTPGSAGKALADSGGGSSPSVIASAVRTELTTELGRIDANVSSRLPTAGYTAPANSDITAIKNKTDALPTDPADNSEILSAIPSASTIASQVRTELSTELGRIDGTITSRASQTSVNAIPTNPLLTTDVRLNNLDVAISTRLATAGYSAPISASAIATQVRTELAVELARIDSAISTRLASAGYTAPPTVSAIADAVWDELLSGHAISGSTGEALTSASSGGSSPSAIASAVRTELATELARIDATITSRLSSAGYTVPPSASVIAGQVRTELGTELGRIDTAISSRLASIDTNAIANAVWTATTRSLNVDVTLGSSEITEIATAIQAAIINEGDGQMVIDAIVQAIGNVNVPASVIASAVRTELTTELGRIDVTLSTRASQSSVNSIPTNPLLTSDSRLNNLDATVSSRSTPANITSAQSAIITEINANETKIDSLPDANQIAQAVLDADLSTHSLVGSVGLILKDILNFAKNAFVIGASK